MGKINWNRVILGGLVAGVIINIFEYVVNGVDRARQTGGRQRPCHVHRVGLPGRHLRRLALCRDTPALRRRPKNGALCRCSRLGPWVSAGRGRSDCAASFPETHHRHRPCGGTGGSPGRYGDGRLALPRRGRLTNAKKDSATHQKPAEPADKSATHLSGQIRDPMPGICPVNSATPCSEFCHIKTPSLRNTQAHDRAPRSFSFSVPCCRRCTDPSGQNPRSNGSGSAPKAHLTLVQANRRPFRSDIRLLDAICNSFAEFMCA